MRRNGWPPLGLALAAALALAVASGAHAATKREAPKVEHYGRGAAYKALARLAVMHEGRVKPIDTLAREEIKQIHGRETIKVLNEDDEVVASWEPVAALFDWSARPDDWNARPIIKVEYLPLKRALLAPTVKAALAKVAEDQATPAADRTELDRLAKLDEVDADDLKAYLRSAGLAEEARTAVARLAAKLGEGHKWLAPKELERSSVGVGGRAVPFAEWIDSIGERKAAEAETGVKASLTELEKKGYEVGTAYARYRALRDRELTRFLPISIVPRPSNPTYIAYSGEVMKRFQAEGRGLEPAMLDREVAVILNKYLEDLQRKDMAIPGTDPAFDAKYADWLRDKSVWVPLPILLEVGTSDLERAGYPVAKVDAFRSAFQAFEAAEAASPGLVEPGPAEALVASARDLGQSLNPSSYPSEAAMSREVGFNAAAPFWWAPFVYGAGAVLLLLSLTLRTGEAPLVVSIRRALYAAGLLGFVAGIGLEAFGFSQRVLISGWAPVTNMYETVIWVALVTSVIGLVLELIYRKTYAALAGAGVAAVATALAATVPLLDPTIKSLQPVLRSNLWLSIHVLTIVSSYAAFALAMGLGMIATGYYLTTTYRRSATFTELAAPIAVGAPVLALGIVALAGSYSWLDLGRFVADYGFWPSLVLIAVGGVATLMVPVAVVGELINRSVYARTLAGTDKPDPVAELPVPMAHNRELVGAGGPLPPISGGSPDLSGSADLRARAMHETALRIKPLANFIYRSMQVGVLLVAAGTILGGVWADYSWGRFWGWDPKEVWALITLLVYLVPLHGRFAGWVNTFGLVMASVVCFLSVLMAWYGVNFVLGVGLHSYGFGEGGSQGTVGIATLIVLAIPAGAAWRRRLSQRADATPAVAHA